MKGVDLRSTNPGTLSAGFFAKVFEQQSGWRVVHSGGNSNNGDQAGFATLNANNSSSNRNANIASHVCLLILPCSKTLPLGKTHNTSHISAGNGVTAMNALGLKQSVV